MMPPSLFGRVSCCCTLFVPLLLHVDLPDAAAEVHGGHGAGEVAGWCDRVNAAQPGDEVVLQPGVYAKPCVVRAAGTADKPITVRSVDAGTPVDEQPLASRAQLMYAGSDANIVELRSPAKHLVFKGLWWSSGSGNGADALRFIDVSDITVDNCLFEKLNSQAITANSDANTTNIAIQNSVFRDLPFTVIYLGCHDGSCRCTNYTLRNNLITASSPGFVVGGKDGTGYCVEAKVNSQGTVAGNTFYHSKGPNLAVYGAADGASKPTLVERNWFSGSKNDGALWIGGGPVIARHNVASSGADAGIGTQDYGGRGLQRNITIAFNTVLNSKIGVQLNAAWVDVAQGNTVAYNLVAGTGASEAVSPSRPAKLQKGNQLCKQWSDCFAGSGLAPWNLAPSPSVATVSCPADDAWWSPVDLFGTARACHDGTKPGAVITADMPVSGFPGRFANGTTGLPTR
jgi:hypothetical protein